MSEREIYLTFDEELDFWRKVSSAPFMPDAIVPVGKYIYLFNRWTNSLRYDLLDGESIRLRGVKRLFQCIVELNKKIYASGGMTVTNRNRERFSQFSDTVECYDPNSEEWKNVKSMGKKFVQTAVVMFGRIYAIGCTNFVDMWMRVYDAITDIWNAVEPPSVCGPKFSAVVFENRLCLVEKKLTHIGSVYAEVYDPFLDVWTKLPGFPFKYLEPKPLVLAGRLMVFDNRRWNGRRGAPAVCWNGVMRTWQVTDKSFVFYKSVEQYKFSILSDPTVIRELVNRSRHRDAQFDRILLSE